MTPMCLSGNSLNSQSERGSAGTAQTEGIYVFTKTVVVKTDRTRSLRVEIERMESELSEDERNLLESWRVVAPPRRLRLSEGDRVAELTTTASSCSRKPFQAQLFAVERRRQERRRPQSASVAEQFSCLVTSWSIGMTRSCKSVDSTQTTSMRGGGVERTTDDLLSHTSQLTGSDELPDGMRRVCVYPKRRGFGRTDTHSLSPNNESTTKLQGWTINRSNKFHVTQGSIKGRFERSGQDRIKTSAPVQRR